MFNNTFNKLFILPTKVFIWIFSNNSILILSIKIEIITNKLVNPIIIINIFIIDSLDILINKMGIIIENSKKDHPYTMDIYTIKEFINNAKEVIDEELKKY